MADTVRTGLVGAGPWATVMHAPLLAGGPGTSLEAVWARREDAATELARQYGASVAGSFDELLERCDAIAFAVPPDVQAALAPRAAAAGKHLLLEKPLAFSLADAERLAAAVDEAGVRTLLFLTNRFTAEGREFVRRAAEAEPQAAQARSLGGGSLPGSFFATPWRVARGALLDLGPHVLDLLVAALGPVAEITATGDPTRVVALTTRHESGVLGQALLSITTADAEDALVCHVHTDHRAGRLRQQDGDRRRGRPVHDRPRVLRVGPHRCPAQARRPPGGDAPAAARAGGRASEFARAVLTPSGCGWSRRRARRGTRRTGRPGPARRGSPAGAGSSRPTGTSPAGVRGRSRRGTGRRSRAPGRPSREASQETQRSSSSGDSHATYDAR